jgi:hypothetical protein
MNFVKDTPASAWKIFWLKCCLLRKTSAEKTVKTRASSHKNELFILSMALSVKYFNLQPFLYFYS